MAAVTHKKKKVHFPSIAEVLQAPMLPQPGAPLKATTLDGRKGGGQLVRNALCLSALTGIPVHIHHIRGNRAGGGGLKAQHDACVKWLARACRARVEGAEVGSTSLLFEPGKAGDEDDASRAASYSPAFKKVMSDGEPAYECRIDIGTAGSTALALQAILPFILFTELPSAIPIRLTVAGGTNVSNSPSYDYVSQVLLPTLKSIGFPKMQARLDKRGWAHGGTPTIGSFTVTIPPRSPVALPAFDIDPDVHLDNVDPQIRRLQVTFLAPQACHLHFRDSLQTTLKETFGYTLEALQNRVKITCEESGHEKRMYLLLVASISTKVTPTPNVATQTFTPPPARHHILASDILWQSRIGSHDIVAEEMITRAASKLKSQFSTGAGVDANMRDQLVIFQALADGKSRVFGGSDELRCALEPSSHTKSAIWVAEQILDVEFKAGGMCKGMGYGKQQDSGVTVAGAIQEDNEENEDHEDEDENNADLEVMPEDSRITSRMTALVIE